MIQLPEVSELVEYFDALALRVHAEDQDANPWEALTSAEISLLQDQIQKCRDDFRYACGNYFWLSQTEAADRQLIDLLDAQEILLELVLHFWRMGKPARIMVHKARQLGISTVSEALMAWRMIFFQNQIGVIVAQDPDEATHLFEITLFIVDNLPWWMRPMEASREIKQYVLFENPDAHTRRENPGLHNYLIAHGCNKLSSFGQGKKIHACHISEVASWRPQWRAREIIDGDILYALANAPGAFCFLESKPKGVGGYWYKLWHTYADKGERAQFYPLFIPTFFEKSRRVPPPSDFTTEPEENAMRERFAIEWHRCDTCKHPIAMTYAISPKCLYCGSDKHSPWILDDAQIYWYRELQGQVKGDPERHRLFLQEMAVTAEEGFQVHGVHVFPDDVLHYLERVCRPGTRGFFDERLEFHSGKPCKVCRGDHTDEDFPLQVWEEPQKNCRYVAGVDVSEGGQEGDFSVIHMIRIGYLLDPDTQVLEWRGRVDAVELARICYILGRAYNNAMISIEVAGTGSLLQHELMNKLKYDEIFRWKNYDSTNPMTNKWGWVTNTKTRPMIITNAIRWLRKRLWKPQSPAFLSEVRTFVRDENESKAQAASGTFDDSCMAGLICCFCAHESDYDPMTGRISIPRGRDDYETQPLNWTCVCICGKHYDVAEPGRAVCPDCGKKPATAARKNQGIQRRAVVNFVDGGEEAVAAGVPNYDCL